MYGYIHKSDDKINSARDAVYQHYEGSLGQSYTKQQQSLLEAAKSFFTKRRAIGSIRAFNESVTASIKPEWLLWAISPALPQTDHRNIVTHTRVQPQSPPWR